MINLRRDYFPANDWTVITGLCPNGEYGAYKLDYEDEPRIRGYGHSRLAAIADLVEALSDTEEDEERNSAAFQIDHERDYRKHGGRVMLPENRIDLFCACLMAGVGAFAIAKWVL